MKNIVVISGKGGTGKTIITASLAALSENACFADCDVDAADLYLLLSPQVKQQNDFKCGFTAHINKDLCRKCGKCIEVCKFSAISDNYIVDSINCEGCKVCSYICPFKAIEMKENLSGEWFISDTKYGPMVHAKLGIAEENSGKLVSLVKQQAKKIAEENNKDYIIVDGPPGIGCPLIASLSNVDVAVIVTEPTLSGMHDMKRVLDVARYFKINSKVVINKYDINPKNTEEIKQICEKEKIEVLAQLPFSKKVSEALLKGMPVVEFTKEPIAQEIINLWEKIKRT